MDVCPGGAEGPNSLTITSLDGYTGSPTVTFPTLPAGITVTPATIPVPLLPPARKGSTFSTRTVIRCGLLHYHDFSNTRSRIRTYGFLIPENTSPWQADSSTTLTSCCSM